MKSIVTSPCLLLFLCMILFWKGLFSQRNSHNIHKHEKFKKALLSYEKYIDANHDAHLKEFMEIISIPGISSISSHRRDVERTASWIVNKLISIGISNAQTLPTGGSPIVFGSWEKAAGRPTVLIYAHYDVQPVIESEWDSPPFSAKIEEGKILGRGASDDKSGVMISIWAVETLLKTEGKLPVNVKFVFEGEEEIGSPNFRNFLISHKDIVKADYALNADGSQYSETMPSILMSLRGSMAMEFSIKTANIDAHSGMYGGKTPNAAAIMSQIISSFYTKEGNVAVAGFYDKVFPISQDEKDMINRIPYDRAVDMKILGTTAEAGDTSFSPLERIWYRPTLEIVGMQSGYTGEGHANIIPGTAMARVTCRLVDDQNGSEIAELIKKHIQKNCPPGAAVSFKISSGFAKPLKFPANTKAFNEVSESLFEFYGVKPLQIAAGFSTGSLMDLKEILGVYPYSLGFELPDENWHASNEFFRISDMKRGQLVYCYYLNLLAANEN